MDCYIYGLSLGELIPALPDGHPEMVVAVTAGHVQYSTIGYMLLGITME